MSTRIRHNAAGQVALSKTIVRAAVTIALVGLRMSLPMLVLWPPASAATERFHIVSLQPRPNYPLTEDAGDAEQLSDGITVAHPIWLHREAVGWNKRTPITMHAALSRTNTQKGVLRLHTSKRTNAGVFIPARIDVYRGDAEKEGLRHAGTFTPWQDDYRDDDTYWLEVPVRGTGRDIVIVVHAYKGGIFFDEIEWQSRDINNIIPDNRLLSLNSITADSIQRLRAQYEVQDTERHARRISEWHRVFGGKAFIAWAQEPWGTLESYPSAETINAAPATIDIRGTGDEYESGCIGVLNLRSSEVTVRFHAVGSVHEDLALQWRVVEKVLVADGSMALDPLIPLSSDRTISISPASVRYVWFTLHLGSLPLGQHAVDVEILDSNGQVLARLPISISVFAPRAGARPAAVVWGYSDGLPIWRDKQAAIEDQVLHGVNVFLIPPVNIPQPEVDGKWDVYAARRLAMDLELYRGRGRVLLALGWGPGTRPAWIDPSGTKLSPPQVKVLRDWYRKLVQVVRASGYEDEEWAIYPVDEPHGNRLSLLKMIAPLFKEFENSVHIYTNPANSRNGGPTNADLRFLTRYIDIWQPSEGYVASSGTEFFGKQVQDWWVYDNPNPPAKKASPFAEYRLIAWRAWARGASGVGFWSYSDTQNSSAWNDLDGVGPDWAVVYEAEGDGRPVTSRRWEAFREGIEDFSLLNAVSSVPACAPTLTMLKEEVINGDLSASRMEYARAVVLSGCLER